ncbi:MAG TPA: pyruvate dehydrogenase (acetyl-transferring) E1 component subunit alpha [Steroidobacteraceae bacterium]|nr:pyruvate dehydrogenase (acetyl-transferring) E1 component subunit alpha [Steroidobacteraceae bacterium]
MSEAATQIDRDRVLHLLREMLRIRCFEDRCAELYTQGHIRGFLHLYNGEEAVAVGVMQALTAEDAIVSTYREHGHALARGVSMNALMAELCGKATGCSRGRGGSMHIFDKATNFYGGNAIVGGGIPIAIGLALAYKMQKRSAIAVCFFGEGAAAEGDFHESLNLASLWKLPVLFVCDNNQYAMGTALRRSEAETSIANKATSYRVASKAIDGMNVLTVESATREAVANIRAGKGPVLLEMLTYRFRAHSMFDAQLYRNKAEVEEWQTRGPLISFTKRFKEAGLLTEEDYQRIEREANAEVDAAVKFAHESEFEPANELLRFVHAEVRA